MNPYAIDNPPPHPWLLDKAATRVATALPATTVDEWEGVAVRMARAIADRDLAEMSAVVDAQGPCAIGIERQARKDGGLCDALSLCVQKDFPEGFDLLWARADETTRSRDRTPDLFFIAARGMGAFFPRLASVVDACAIQAKPIASFPRSKAVAQAALVADAAQPDTGKNAIQILCSSLGLSAGAALPKPDGAPGHVELALALIDRAIQEPFERSNDFLQRALLGAALLFDFERNRSTPGAEQRLARYAAITDRVACAFLEHGDISVAMRNEDQKLSHEVMERVRAVWERAQIERELTLSAQMATVSPSKPLELDESIGAQIAQKNADLDPSRVARRL